MTPFDVPKLRSLVSPPSAHRIISLPFNPLHFSWRKRCNLRIRRARVPTRLIHLLNYLALSLPKQKRKIYPPRLIGILKLNTVRGVE